MRLAVARYQPDSLPGLHLGPVHLCDWVQPAPERVLRVAPTDSTHLKVELTGPVATLTDTDVTGPGLADSRTVSARIETRIPDLDSDLAWQVESVTSLPVVGADGLVVTWFGDLALPATDPGRPDGAGQVRLVVEEREHLPADLDASGAARTLSRLCYADAVVL